MKQIFVFASLLVVMTASAQTISKKVSLAKGQQLEQLSKTTVNMTQELMGQSMEIQMESNSTNLLEVKDDNSAGYSLSNTLKKVLMNMNVSGQETKFDSEKKEDMDGQLGSAFKNKINKPREFVVGKDGIITSVKEVPKAEEGADMIGGMLNGAEETPGAAFIALANIPAKGAKVGDSWTDSTSDKTSRTVNRYTLRQVNNGEGTVDINSDLNINREMEQQGMTMQMAMKGTSIGEYTFDVTTGLVKSRKTMTKATGSIDVMGQTVPLTIESSTTSTVTAK